jgi:hypothetical protein
MITFDCPNCQEAIQTDIASRGHTACPFCLHIVAVPVVEAVVLCEEESGANHDEILEAEVVHEHEPRPPAESLTEPREPLAYPAASAAIMESPTENEFTDGGEDFEPVSPRDWREVREAEKRSAARRRRRVLVFWLLLLFNLVALTGFTLVGLRMWEINQGLAYICFSGAVSTLFFLLVQIWPRRRRRA